MTVSGFIGVGVEVTVKTAEPPSVTALSLVVMLISGTSSLRTVFVAESCDEDTAYRRPGVTLTVTDPFSS